MHGSDRADTDTQTAEAELADLYAQHRSSLLNYLTRLIHDRDTAEDLCQESFAKVIRHWAERDPHKDSVAWLYRIATNTAFDELRRARRRQAGVEGSWEAADPAPPLETCVSEALAVRAALARLPQADRTVLLLQAYEDRKLHDIAALLQCSLNATKSRLHRARARFRQVYQG